MGTLLIYAAGVGVLSLIGLVMYKVSKHDTAVMNDEIDRIEREDSEPDVK
jgi:heme exporter protein D